MHRYSVTYIERDGAFDKQYVLAKNKAEARRIAEEKGCEDILCVKHAGVPFAAIVVTVIIAALAAVAYCVR